MAAPLPNWKELTYEQIDICFGESVYREVQLVVNAKFSEGAVDLFMTNVEAMSEQLGILRDRVGAAL